MKRRKKEVKSQKLIEVTKSFPILPLSLFNGKYAHLYCAFVAVMGKYRIPSQTKLSLKSQSIRVGGNPFFPFRSVEGKENNGRFKIFASFVF